MTSEQTLEVALKYCTHPNLFRGVRRDELLSRARAVLHLAVLYPDEPKYRDELAAIGSMVAPYFESFTDEERAALLSTKAGT